MELMLLHAHSGLRYLVLLAALVALVFVAKQRNSGGEERTRLIAMRVFVGLLDVQLLLGIGLLLTRPFLPLYIGHLVLMVLAIAVAHVCTARLRRTTDPRRAYLISLFGIMLPLLSIIIGIASLDRPVL